VRLEWPGGITLHADVEKAIGEPDHPESLALDAVLAIFGVDGSQSLFSCPA
jgi:hypothetical protein